MQDSFSLFSHFNSIQIYIKISVILQQLYIFFHFGIYATILDSEEALGQLLNESDNEVFERSSDEESSVGIGEKPEVFDKNNNKKKNELVVSLRRLTADKQLQSSEFKTTQLQREGRRMHIHIFLLA